MRQGNFQAFSCECKGTFKIGPRDWSEEHDHYLYGTPKRGKDREDKEWGLTDCISFIVMEDHGLTDALTTDEHFEQAGFRALLREDM